MRLIRKLSFVLIAILALLISPGFSHAQQGHIGYEEIVIDGITYKRAITEFQKISPSNESIPPSVDTEYLQQDPYPSLDGQTVSPTVICEDASESKCISIGGLKTVATGDPVNGDFYRQTSLWQQISYNGKTYYAPYDELDFGHSGNVTTYNTSNFDATGLAKDLGIGYGITTKIEAPFKMNGVKYKWTMNADGTYLTKMSKVGAENKYVALDYGYNKITETANIHINQQGVSSEWGVTNHEVIGPKDLELKINGEPFRPVVSETYGPVPLNAAEGLRYGGTALLVVGAASDAYSIYTAENKPKEATRVVGGWTGAYVGAEAGAWAGATAGAAVGAFFAGVGAVPGAAIGGFLGGLIGGIIGYSAGSAVAEGAYDYATQ